jgi:hypothetical protein
MTLALALGPASAVSPAPADPAASRQRIRLEQIRQAYGFKSAFPKDQLRQVGNLIIFDSNLREYQRRREAAIQDYRSRTHEAPQPYPGMDTLSQSTYSPQTVKSLRLDLAATLATLRACAAENFNAGRPVSCALGDSARVEGEGAIAVDPDSYASNGALAEGGAIACGIGASAVGSAVAIGDGSHADGRRSPAVVVDKAGTRADAARSASKHCGPNAPARLDEELDKLAARAP